MSDRKIGPCVLDGKFVRLEPLREEHTGPLLDVAMKLDWKLMLHPLRSREDVDRRIRDGLRMEEDDGEFAFAVVLKSEQLVIGSTAYLNVVSGHKRVEIGSTWYGPHYWGTAVNPECKFLLMRHAFEDWGAVRVQLGTDVNNLHSSRAISKLGAKLEGTLRNHGIRPDGSIRDAALYSIISNEWPDIKARLLSRLEAFESLATH